MSEICTADTAPVLVVDGFAGPLDWIVAMARAHQIDLARLSIAALVEAFAVMLEAALQRVPDLAGPDLAGPDLAGPDLARPDLARWAVWTVMAADLAELRSRLCLPQDTDASSARGEAEALRRHWLQRAETKAAADWLMRRPCLGFDVFPRGGAETAAPQDRLSAAVDADDENPVPGGDITDLLRACLAALALPPHIQTTQPPRPPFWSVNDATARMARLLETRPEGADLAAFLPPIAITPNCTLHARAAVAATHARAAVAALHARAAVAATLRAALELSRSGAVTLDQDAAWQPILIRPTKIKTLGAS